MKTANNDGKSFLKKLNRWLTYITDHEFLLATLLVVIMVCLTVGLGLQRDKITSPNPWVPSHYLLEPTNHLTFLANWDGKGYISIAKGGYSSGLTNYFPLYPLLIHLVNKVISSPLYSALLVSWACLVGAVFFYIKIVKRFFNVKQNIEALKAVAIFLIYPTGIFLIASYTESLFAFVSLAAIYFALKKKYLWSGLFALLATATHINGLMTLLLVLMILYEEHVRVIKILQTFIVGMLGIIGYMFYLKVKFHNALDFITQQRSSHDWLHHTLIPELAHINPLEYLFVSLVVVTTVYWWPRRKSFATYSLLYLMIPIIGGTFGGFTRYSLMIFPAQFMIFEVFRKKTFGYGVILALFAIGWTFFAIGFMAGYIA